MKKIKGIRGIRKRWMVNSISVVLFIVLLAVAAFSAAMGSYYYSTLSESLKQKAENAIQQLQLLPHRSRVLRQCPGGGGRGTQQRQAGGGVSGRQRPDPLFQLRPDGLSLPRNAGHCRGHQP